MEVAMEGRIWGVGIQKAMEVMVVMGEAMEGHIRTVGI